MPAFIDRTGERFGSLVIQRRASRRGTYWECLCDCGNSFVSKGSDIQQGKIKSCGCLRKPHGLRNHPLYAVWRGMKSRCTNPKHFAWGRYGGRGITVCPEWREDCAAFINWALAGGYSNGLQLDREDNDGDYTPQNCRFVTPEENNHNREGLLWITHNGERKCLAEWSRVLDIKESTLRGRIARGMAVEDAFRCTKYRRTGLGVWQKKNGKWVAEIYRGKKIHIGTYSTKDEAILARKQREGCRGPL